jgi:hypothetical protein
VRTRKIGIGAVAVVLVVALVVGMGVSGGDNASEGDVRGDGSVGATLDPRFIGLTSDEASALAASEQRPWRIGREDEVWLAVTDDYVVGRVTLELDDGLVTSADIEQPHDLGDSGVPVAQKDLDRAAVLAAAVRQLLTVDHGFGDGPSPFTEVRIADAFAGKGGALLEPLQLELVAAAVNESGATVEYVDDPQALIEKLFDQNPRGTAVLTIAALSLESDGAEVELHLWCGSLCGVFITYEVVQSDGAWVVTGAIGPLAMS